MSLPKKKDTHYSQLLTDIKNRVRNSQIKATRAINNELILLYWHIGKSILDKQTKHGWGAKVVDQLSQDLQKDFPGMKGFSPRNLKYMRALAEKYPNEQFVQQAVAQIPWGHNVILLDKVKDEKQREWYIKKAIENGWSRNVLAIQIDTQLFDKQGKAETNFSSTLPSPQSDLAQELLKDPYNFDFLEITDDVHERELEKGLLEHIRDFMLELGVGFAFVGNQYHLEVAGDDFYIDLLFYHLKLRCYVVIELKTGKFKPEYAGKMNFYLSAIDDLVKHSDDNPSLGLILCRDKSGVVVEYSIKDLQKPMGIAEYKLTEMLPESLKGKLPTVEEIENEVASKLPKEEK